MKRFQQPERTNELPIGESERPQPWHMPPKKDHETDVSGWLDSSGITVWLQITDQTGYFKALSNREAVLYAAAQIHGASAYINQSSEAIGEAETTSNRDLYKLGNEAEITSAMTISGATPEEIAYALTQMIEQTTLISASEVSEVDMTEIIPFHT